MSLVYSSIRVVQLYNDKVKKKSFGQPNFSLYTSQNLKNNKIWCTDVFYSIFVLQSIFSFVINFSPLLNCPYHNFDHITEFDALNTEARANPYPYFDWLRADADRRVYPLPGEHNFFMLHKMEDVKAAFTDFDTFSSHIIPTDKAPFLALMGGADHKRIRGIVQTIFNKVNLEEYELHLQRRIEALTVSFSKKNKANLLDEWAVPIPLFLLANIFDYPTDNASIQSIANATMAINKALFVVGGTGPKRSHKPTVKEKD